MSEIVWQIVKYTVNYILMSSPLTISDVIKPLALFGVMQEIFSTL